MFKQTLAASDPTVNDQHKQMLRKVLRQARRIAREHGLKLRALDLTVKPIVPQDRSIHRCDHCGYYYANLLHVEGRGWKYHEWKSCPRRRRRLDKPTGQMMVTESELRLARAMRQACEEAAAAQAREVLAADAVAQVSPYGPA